MLIIIIILAFVAGFFQSSLEVEERKSRLLEKKIVKLENQLKNQIENMEF